MNELDDAARLAAQDPGGMLGMVRGLPAQFGRAAQARQSFLETARVGPFPSPVRDVLVCGMGGSAIGGDIAAAWAEPHGLRVAVHRGYGLPAWVRDDTLLVFSSYSGNTEETLSAFAAAGAASPKLALATGGALAARARAAGIPVYPLVPGLQPRAALGHSLTGVLLLLHAAGLVPDPVPEIEAAAAHLASLAACYAPESPEAANPAKQLARTLHAHLPVLYTGTGLLQPVGVRWKGQINENAKCLAMAAVFPELDHNEIMGWQALPELRARARLVVLRDRDDGAAVHRRMEVTCDILAPRVAGIEWIDTTGDGRLERALGAVCLGDWMSVYLAFLSAVDPTPVAEIELLKRRLAAATTA